MTGEASTAKTIFLGTRINMFQSTVVLVGLKVPLPPLPIDLILNLELTILQPL